ncbi:4-hydroxybenzoate octaprenyltransferase [Phaeovulum vinaykumarii]|uniref:4-hydroxybenzoate octaprenyltransferase n=1 Tax=Phaeovulum vinaykumarii TaxID=407234 RepID=A0A1N7JS40_9RHOB|nr:4-hydroxybenzoate octaprenyltransferase [Phaeovulum vinaykumarii]SIS52135.1 4-hydroxybenzoate polyprenyltransferase [Phaeovulum vinaykumarii]SOB91094.1 4-hydroxybenzoate polyprenyltransferase [Phaeovulum vinaykumarii]
MSAPGQTPEPEDNRPQSPQGSPDPAGRVADAYSRNWVDSYAPEWARPYLRLARADRPIGTWLLLLPCWWGLALAASTTGVRAFDIWIAVGCAIGAFLMRGAGCTWNDITDRNIDGSVARTRSRPIPSGQVTVKGALLFAIGLSLVASLILFSFNVTAILLGIASLGLVAIYPFAKRFTWWPQIFLGLAFNWGVLVAWAAHGAEMGLAPVLLYASGIAWTLFYDTIYAHQDKEDDALIGVKSTARLFAEDTPIWLMRFMLSSVVLMAAAVLVALLPTDPSWPKLFLAICAPWSFGWHMTWQLRQLDTENPDTCLRLFRASRDTGLLPALFLAAAAVH